MGEAIFYLFARLAEIGVGLIAVEDRVITEPVAPFGLLEDVAGADPLEVEGLSLRRSQIANAAYELSRAIAFAVEPIEKHVPSVLIRRIGRGEARGVQPGEFAEAIDFQSGVICNHGAKDFAGEGFGLEIAVVAITVPGLLWIAFDFQILGRLNCVPQRREDLLVFFLLTGVVGG